jgi:xanthine dehydrogenase accessory factor
VKREVLDALRAARRDRRPVALVTDLTTGEQHLLDATSAAMTSPLEGEVGPEGRVRGLVPPSLSREVGKTGVANTDSGETFTQAFIPTPRLIIVGAVHIAQRLTPIARLAGFAVSVVDPREAFASTDRFPDVTLVRQWPDLGLEMLAPDAATAVVTLTHDPKLDDPALIVALRSPAFFVGALGSRKTHGKRLDRLRTAGFDDVALARLHAPVGLPIGAISPGEIAVSIMAEIVASRHGKVLQASGG